MNALTLLAVSGCLFVSASIAVVAQAIPTEQKVKPVAVPIPTQLKPPEGSTAGEAIESFVRMVNAPFEGADMPDDSQVEYAVVPARQSVTSSRWAGIGSAPSPESDRLDLESERLFFLLAGKKGWMLIGAPNPSYNFYVFRREKSARFKNSP